MKYLTEGKNFETIMMALFKIATLTAKISAEIIKKMQINGFKI